MNCIWKRFHQIVTRLCCTLWLNVSHMVWWGTKCLHFILFCSLVEWNQAKKTGRICYLSNKPHAAQNVVVFCPQNLRAISLFWKCVTFVTPTSNLPFWLQMEALFAFQKKIKPHKKRPPYIFQAPSTDTTVMVRVRLFYINVKAKSLFPLRRFFFILCLQIKTLILC